MSDKMPSWGRKIAMAIGLTAGALTISGTARAASEDSVIAVADASRQVAVDCPQLGTLVVRLDVDAPPVAVAAPPGVALRVGYRLRARRSGVVLQADPEPTQPGMQPCGRVMVRGVRATALPRGLARSGVTADEPLDGTVTLGVTVTTDAQAPGAGVRATEGAVAAAGATVALPFDAAVRSYLATRSGRASIAVYDARTGVTYAYAPGASFVTASVAKVAILGRLLRQAQDAGRPLTATELSLATRMIGRSDNAAATALWNQVGKGPGVATFGRQAGLSATTPGPGGYWGLTTTTALDQVRLLRTIGYPNTVLGDSGRGQALGLMRAVTPSQRWGITGGVPASATVALKNGWLPHSDGWVINSVGQVRGGDRDYAIAVLSSGNPSMQYGIATVQHLSSLVWSRLPHPGRRADLDGVRGTGGASGRVELHRLSGATGFGAWSLHRASAFVAPASAERAADWQFAVAPTGGGLGPDLVGVVQRNTGSGRVEVHVASGISGYTAFSRHTATALPAVDPRQWQFAVGPVGGDGGADLIAIRTDGTASGQVEVSVLSEATNYQEYLVRSAATPLPAGPEVAARWRWLLGDGGDLVGVAHGATGSGGTEVHVLSWTGGYQSWSRHARTPLAYTDDDQWQFTLADADGNAIDDLFAIRTVGGASGRLEAHVLSGATGFGTWLRHAATAMPAPVPPTWRWSAY